MLCFSRLCYNSLHSNTQTLTNFQNVINTCQEVYCMSNSEPVLVLVEVCVTKHEAPSNPVTSSCKSDLKKIAKQKQTHTQNSF